MTKKMLLLLAILLIASPMLFAQTPQNQTANGHWVPISAGQRIMYDYGGGGGWGNPLDRDPQAVLDDVIDEYVSVEGARRDYGVVLTGSLDDLTLAVDEAATRAERQGRL